MDGWTLFNDTSAQFRPFSGDILRKNNKYNEITRYYQLNIEREYEMSPTYPILLHFVT